MLIVRYVHALKAGPSVGLLLDDGTLIRIPVDRLADLLAMPLADARRLVETAASSTDREPELCRFLPPVDGRTEVWAGGVTYRRSQEARIEESSVKDVYSRVYDAVRPELFFKSVAWRCVADGEFIGIRSDSELNVPEPEAALVANAFGELVGLTVCNDVSSRSIEGENPLYLPQAKIYAGACALGPGIRPIWTIPDPADLRIQVVVQRGGADVWAEATSTNMMHRPFAELLEFLFRADSFPEGAILSTGTGLVPPIDFTLREGDTVAVTIESVGTLTNTVTVGPSRFAVLASSVAVPHLRPVVS